MDWHFVNDIKGQYDSTIKVFGLSKKQEGDEVCFIAASYWEYCET